MLTVTHADGLVIDELTVTGDGDRTGRDRELLTESLGDAPHLTALLTGRTAVLGLREGLEEGERDSSGGGGGKEVLDE